MTILGAGLTGLSCALQISRRASQPFVLVEREDRVGGHARSFRKQGHCFDVTGHWLHLRDARTQAWIDELFEAETWSRIDRKTTIWSHGAELAYPFQANLHGLPLEVVQECLVAFVQAQRKAAVGATTANTFTAFAEARFGKGIARHFFVPYNTKLWGMSPDKLTADWVSRFIPLPEVEQVIGGALGLRQEGLGYNAHFLYPKAGGIDALPKALRAKVEEAPAGRLITSTSADSIDLKARRVQLAGEKESRAFSSLVSTMPLPELIARIEDVPAQIRDAASALKWVRWRYLDLATRIPSRREWHWSYVPERKYPFFRVGCYTNAVSSMAPEGCGSFYVELEDRDSPPDEREVVKGLVEMGVLDSHEDLRFSDLRDVQYAYVVFDDAYQEATQTIHAWLAAQGVRSCGRYGAWIYNSMEDSMLQGMDAADWALGQEARG